MEKLVFILCAVLLSLSFASQKVLALSSLVQITSSSYQERDPHIWGDNVVYTTFGGVGGIDIWKYNLATKQHTPIIERDGQQFVTDIFGNKVVYEEYDEVNQRYQVYLYDLNNNQDKLISAGNGNYGSGVTNDRFVFYIDGYSCGKLMAYDTWLNQTKVIAQNACRPSASFFYVSWDFGGEIYAKQLYSGQLINVSNKEGIQEQSNITGNQVVWIDTSENKNRVMVMNLGNYKREVIAESSTASYSGPSVSWRYIAWGKSTAPHFAGVEAYDLLTKQTLEVQEQGPHQNSNLQTDLWWKTTVWQAWRTGNGDIYGSVF